MTDTMDPWAALVTPDDARTSRSLETRGSTERKRGWVEPTLLPDPAPIDGWRFKWIRQAARGADDKTNVDKRLREGWEPVRAEEHPEIFAEWHVKPKNGLVEYGGLLLCKMPEEWAQQRNQTYLRRAMDNLNSAEESYMRDSDEIMRKFQENRRRVVFGRDRAR